MVLLKTLWPLLYRGVTEAHQPYAYFIFTSPA